MTSQRNAEDDATKRSIEQIGRKAVVYAANLASNDSIDDLTKVLLADGHRIDILVNCAGIQRRHASHEFPNEDWDEVNLLTFLISSEAELRVDPASQPIGGFQAFPQRGCSYAGPALEFFRQTRQHHQHCFPDVISRRVEYPGLCCCERRHSDIDQGFGQRMGQ